ncbi:MAG: caspase family protein [Cyclobacteriaceae bacterium]|nr:caspase family protein [Cyclobacteriaceae bacterium]
MKNVILLLLAQTLSVSFAFAQNVTSRSNEFVVDYSNPAKLVESSFVPTITWIAPLAENLYSESTKVRIAFEAACKKRIKSVTMALKESAESEIKGASVTTPQPGEELKVSVDRTLTLQEGSHYIEIQIENVDGIKTLSNRIIRVGSAALADAAKLDRTDYAILFTSNDYDNWPDLVNPINDGRMIAEELRKNYGYKVEVMENGTQAEILTKIREYSEKKYKPLDQLFIFFAGHGQYDETFGEGFVVTRESLANDVAKTSYLSHNRLRSIINNIPCEHIYLTMDVCFGGTFDDAIAHRGMMDEEVYREATQSEMVNRKLVNKTRRYLTSGGKEYVPDGRPGMNSPFARKFLEALRTRGGRDLILTTGEINTFVETLKPQPRSGVFGDNAVGSDFIFIAR